jgi:hypothetical protein
MSPLILVVAVSHNMEERMTRIKILGLAIGASLLVFGYEPIAEATPMAAPLSEVEASTGVVVQQAYYGVARRTARRTTRRVVRRHVY